MDPRLNTGLTPHPQTVVHDVAPPPPVPPAPTANPAPVAPHPPVVASPPAPQTSSPSQPDSNSVSQPMVPQVVAAFPVKQQDGVVAQPQPQLPSHLSSGSPNAPAANDDLDKILQAVNNRVKAPAQPAEPKKKELAKKFGAKTSKLKSKNNNPKPIGPIVVALIVVLMLSATAVFAYRQGTHATTTASQAGKVGTSYTASAAIQEAGGSLVTPGDLDNYSQTLQTKLNGLNDSQDFTADPLSDQILGL